MWCVFKGHLKDKSQRLGQDFDSCVWVGGTGVTVIDCLFSCMMHQIPEAPPQPGPLPVTQALQQPGQRRRDKQIPIQVHNKDTLLVQDFRQQKIQLLPIQCSRPSRDSQEPKTTKNFNSRDSFFRKSPFCTFSCIKPGFGRPWDTLKKNSYCHFHNASKECFWPKKILNFVQKCHFGKNKKLPKWHF